MTLRPDHRAGWLCGVLLAALPALPALADAPATSSTVTNAAVAPAASFRTIDAAALQVRNGQAGLVVLDVRTAAEYAEGHVPGAINVPYDEVEARLGELDAMRGSEVVVYCRTGRRAGLALDVLARSGFERLRHLEGDIEGWVAADRPVAVPAAR
jgi:phage shock protein E